MKIGIFDSGKGGLSIFDEVKKVLPEAEYKYIADSKNCPYGEKSDEELMEIVRRNVDELSDWGARVIVIACNTATTRCIERLREEYPGLKFVGTEPAIKLAVKTGAKKILVIATPGTIESERMESLLEENKKAGQEFILLSCPGLADAIENDDGVDAKLAELLKDAPEVDCVVLGCTHYSLIREKIASYFPEAAIVDGDKGVAKRVKELVENLWKNE
ncbi:glutamate racemase [Candidatus Saccharibacteria bacterium]|nr:glutamate racemase [Candidatus Saccharibacteria bacterium]